MAKINKLLKLIKNKKTKPTKDFYSSTEEPLLDLDGSPMTNEDYEALMRIAEPIPEIDPLTGKFVPTLAEQQESVRGRMRDIITGKYMDDNGKYTLDGGGK